MHESISLDIGKAVICERRLTCEICKFLTNMAMIR